MLVTGCRPQINERLVAAGRDPISMVEDNGIRRVRWSLKEKPIWIALIAPLSQTDAFTLRCVREASSWARVQLESQVGRGLMSSPYSTGEMHT